MEELIERFSQMLRNNGEVEYLLSIEGHDGYKSRVALYYGKDVSRKMREVKSTMRGGGVSAMLSVRPYQSSQSWVPYFVFDGVDAVWKPYNTVA